MEAEIYTKPHCIFCVKAKALLEQKSIFYREISAVSARDELFERVTEATGTEPKTVPQIFLDGKYIGGHDALVKHFDIS